MSRIALVISAVVLAACIPNLTTPIACTMEARSSFAVTVLDSLTGDNLAPRATVRVTDATFTDTLTALPPPNGVYSGGVYERPGVYEVSVDHPGYATWRMSDVRVDSDACHVKTRALTARLARA